MTFSQGSSGFAVWRISARIRAALLVGHGSIGALQHAVVRSRLSEAPDAVIDRVRASLQTRIENTRAGMDGTEAPEPDGLTEPELRRDLIAAESTELGRLYDSGTISDATRQLPQHNLDLETTRLTDDQH